MYNSTKRSSDSVTCFSCHKTGHKSFECRPKQKRWCDVCKLASHDTMYCRRKDNSAENADNTIVKERDSDAADNHEHSFIIKIIVNDICNSVRKSSLLVDCGATTPIINDKSKFINFDKDFDADNHYIELADGSRTNNVASGRGDASVKLFDINGNACNVMFKNVLYVPSLSKIYFPCRPQLMQACLLISIRNV